MVKKVIKGMSLTIFIVAFLGFAFLFGTSNGHQLRIVGAEVILSSQHRELVKFMFLSENEEKTILKSIQNPEVENLDKESTLSSKIMAALKNTSEKSSTQELLDIYERRNAERGIEEALENNDEEKAEEIKKKYEMKVASNRNSKLKVEVEDIDKTHSDHYYKGKIATISNPFNVSIELSKGREAGSGYGEKVSYIAKKNEAILATNASGFVDVGGNGTGNVPIGILISDGKPISDPGGSFAKDYFAGLTNEGLLVTGYYSTDELLAMNVVDGAGFKPQLISNGKKMITEGNGGWGYGPRTAIGQKEDGSIVIIVIDGRQKHSLGASMKDVQDIMYDAGVVNALAMDGGSSAIMYFGGENVTTPSSLNNVPRRVPSAWIVKANEGQQVEIYENGKMIDSYVK